MTNPKQTLFLFILLLAAAGCGLDETNLQSTAAAQIAAGVAATASALPPATVLPTHTPLATAAAWPTQAEWPTSTPYATATAYPTLTPYPTFTPSPTATATPTPSITPTAAPNSSSNSPGNPPAANLEHQLLDTLYDTHNKVRFLYGLIQAGSNGGTVDCAGIIGTYESLVAAPTYDVSNANSDVVFAYNLYRDAISSLTDLSNSLSQAAENCRHNGENTVFSRQFLGQASLAASSIEGKLTDAIQRLGGEV